MVRALASRSGGQGFESRSFRCDNRKGYIGGWTYPEYFVAWLILVVGFDCWQHCTTLHFPVQNWSKVHCNKLHYFTQHFFLHFITLQWTSLHFTALPLTSASLDQDKGLSGQMLSSLLPNFSMAPLHILVSHHLTIKLLANIALFIFDCLLFTVGWPAKASLTTRHYQSSIALVLALFTVYCLLFTVMLATLTK